MEKYFEKFPLKGILEMKVYKSGKLIEEIQEENLIVDGARKQMAHLIAGEFTKRNITRIAFGTSGTAPTPADKVITGQWDKDISGFSYPEDGRVQFDWGLLTTENNGMAIREFGLITADGILFARRTRTNPIHKASDISIEGRWTIIF